MTTHRKTILTIIMLIIPILAIVASEITFSGGYTKIDMQQGNSGCPVYDKDYYAVGLNSAESRIYPENCARTVTPELLRTLRDKDLFQ